MSMSVIKRLFGRWFLWAHRTVAMGAVGVVLWHIYQTSSTLARALAISSCGFWVATTLFRVLRMVFAGHSGQVLQYSRDMDAVTVSIRLKRAIKVRPGCYFYLYLPSRLMRYNFLHSVTAMVYWYPPENDAEEVKEVTFLLSNISYNAATTLRLQEGQFILLDGPYGQDLQLHKQQNLVLAAKGIGIAAILPLALGIAVRRRHDDIHRAKLQKTSYMLEEVVRNKNKLSPNERVPFLQKEKLLTQQQEELGKKRLHRDAIKKVDLFWTLEDNSQMAWALNELRALKNLDPKNVSILIYTCCFHLLIFAENVCRLVSFPRPSEWTFAFQR